MKQVGCLVFVDVFRFTVLVSSLAAPIL